MTPMNWCTDRTVGPQVSWFTIFPREFLSMHDINIKNIKLLQERQNIWYIRYIQCILSNIRNAPLPSSCTIFTISNIWSKCFENSNISSICLKLTHNYWRNLHFCCGNEDFIQRSQKSEISHFQNGWLWKNLIDKQENSHFFSFLPKRHIWHQF